MNKYVSLVHEMIPWTAVADPFMIVMNAPDEEFATRLALAAG